MNDNIDAHDVNDKIDAVIDQTLGVITTAKIIDPVATAPKVQVDKPLNADSDPGMNLHVLELRVRILGGSKVLLAIDRLACPMPGSLGAERMKSSMYELKKWSDKLDPTQRDAVMKVIGRHVRRAVEIMSIQKKQQESIDE